MKICYLMEKRLPGYEKAASLLPRLSQVAEVAVYTAKDLCEGLSGDVFCNGHGGVYPYEAEEALFAFFQSGGGLLHLYDAPFETPVDEKGGAVHITFGDARRHQGYGPLNEPFDLFRARLGMYTYIPAFPFEETGDGYIEFDPLLVGAEPIREHLPQKGVGVSVTLPMAAAREGLFLQDHRAYQARPAVRETVVAGMAKSGEEIDAAAALLFTKAWGNPYQKDQSVPLRPWAMYLGGFEEKVIEKLLPAMLRWMENPVCLKPTHLPMAALHEGESVTLSPDLFGKLPEGWSVRTLQGVRKMDDLKEKTPVSWETGTGTVHYQKDALMAAVRFEIIGADGALRDFTETAVVMWDKEKVKNHAVRVAPDGWYFKKEKEGQVTESTWVNGTNWQDPNLFAFTWDNPNPLRIASDAYDMARAGEIFVRPHYFMPGWFRVVPGKVYEETHEELFDSFEKGPLLSERHLRSLEAHIALFSAMGLVFHPSIYTSVGTLMGNPSHWMGTSRLFVAEAMIREQEAFARQMMERFGDIPSISWDLINEPDTSMHQAGEWLARHKEIWGKTGQMVGIGTIGMKANVLLGESADWHSQHGGPDDVFHSGKPFLFQEMHNPAPADEEGERELTEWLHRGYSRTVLYGGAGVMPWNWNMSHMNWRYGGGWVDFWDLHLGSAVHADATPRRGLTPIKNWNLFLENLSVDQTRNRQVVYVYPKAFLDGNGSVEYLDTLWREHIPFTTIGDKEVKDFDFSHTKVVILPLCGVGYREESYEALRKFAEMGGTVWAHNDSLCFDENQNLTAREIPEKAGIETVGKGKFVWCMGWNFDKDKDDPYYPDMLELLKVLEKAGVQKCDPNELPLLGGGRLIARTQMTNHLGVMRYAWVPEHILNPARDAKEMRVERGGKLCRAYALPDEEVTEGERVWKSSDHFFAFFEKGHVDVTGGRISVTGVSEIPKLALIDRLPDGKENAIPSAVEASLSGDTLTITQKGWQKKYFVRMLW